MMVFDFKIQAFLRGEGQFAYCKQTGNIQFSLLHSAKNIWDTYKKVVSDNVYTFCDLYTKECSILVVKVFHSFWFFDLM